MLDSIRSRILAACVVIVAGSLAINTYFNYSVANKYNSSAIDNTLKAGHRQSWGWNCRLGSDEDTNDRVS